MENQHHHLTLNSMLWTYSEATKSKLVCSRPDFRQLSEILTLQWVQLEGLGHIGSFGWVDLDCRFQTASEIQTVWNWNQSHRPEIWTSSTVCTYNFFLFLGLQQTSTPLFGLPRDSDVLKVYADAVEKAKADCEKLMVKARQGFSQIEDTKVCLTSVPFPDIQKWPKTDLS